MEGISLRDALKYASGIEDSIERFNKSYLTKTEKVILALKKALNDGSK
ncbi:MAG: hypothetical protein KAS32_26220 [Candidatus Peribacteraceae bacterium]|nr:hypothetical protein [Candidatus Peribacteraceae bacterium]